MTDVKLTLPIDSAERKEYPLFRGCLRYFPAALAGVARISKLGNDKHNPGEPMHHARGKSMDHGDCVIRHLIDREDLLAALERGEAVPQQQILDEVDQFVWRALAFSQELHERFGAPLAPGAKTAEQPSPVEYAWDKAGVFTGIQVDLIPHYQIAWGASDTGPFITIPDYVEKTGYCYDANCECYICTAIRPIIVNGRVRPPVFRGNGP